MAYSEGEVRRRVLAMYYTYAKVEDDKLNASRHLKGKTVGH